MVCIGSLLFSFSNVHLLCEQFPPPPPPPLTPALVSAAGAGASVGVDPALPNDDAEEMDVDQDTVQDSEQARVKQAFRSKVLLASFQLMLTHGN